MSNDDIIVSSDSSSGCDDEGSGCDSTDAQTSSGFMSSYAGLSSDASAFYDMDTSDFIDEIDAGGSFVAVFGFSGCPQCQDAIPVLSDVSKENGITVGYINTRADASWDSNTDIDRYDELCDRVGEYFPIDVSGARHLDVPSVFFVRDGKVVCFHQGTSDDQNTGEDSLTDDEASELAATYQDGFDAMSR